MLNLRTPQLKLRCGCFLNFTFWFILGCLRTCFLAYFLYDVLPRIGFALYYAWGLNWWNYWKSVEEPFRTNASSYNAGLCWVLSIWLMCMSPILALYGCIFVLFLICGLPALLIKGKIKPSDPFKLLLNLTFDVDMDEMKKCYVEKRVV